MTNFQLITFQKNFKSSIFVKNKSCNQLPGAFLVFSDKGQINYSEFSHIDYFHQGKFQQHIELIHSFSSSFKGGDKSEAIEHLKKYINNEEFNLYPSIVFCLESMLFKLQGTSTQNYKYHSFNEPDLNNIQENTFLKIKANNINFKLQIKKLQYFKDTYPTLKYRIDSNETLTNEQVDQLVSLIGLEHIDYLEEPFKNKVDLISSLKNNKLPIALDENLDLIEEQNLLPKAIVIKPTILGLKRAQDLITKAEKLGVVPILSSTYETHIGVENIRLLKCRDLSVQHGLNTAHLIESLFYTNFLKHS